MHGITYLVPGTEGTLVAVVAAVKVVGVVDIDVDVAVVEGLLQATYERVQNLGKKNRTTDREQASAQLDLKASYFVRTAQLQLCRYVHAWYEQAALRLPMNFENVERKHHTPAVVRKIQSTHLREANREGIVRALLHVPMLTHGALVLLPTHLHRQRLPPAPPASTTTIELHT